MVMMKVVVVLVIVAFSVGVHCNGSLFNSLLKSGFGGLEAGNVPAWTIDIRTQKRTSLCMEKISRVLVF